MQHVHAEMSESKALVGTAGRCPSSADASRGSLASGASISCVPAFLPRPYASVPAQTPCKQACTDAKRPPALPAAPTPAWR